VARHARRCKRRRASRLAPQKDWEGNEPARLQGSWAALLEGIAADTGASLADVIVLAGNVRGRASREAAGLPVGFPFMPGRGDASHEMTDAESSRPLEPVADGYRKMVRRLCGQPENCYWTVHKLMGLTPKEMTVLVGGMRGHGNKHGRHDARVFTDRVGALTPDFFREP